jgi:hypothetical protein
MPSTSSSAINQQSHSKMSVNSTSPQARCGTGKRLWTIYFEEPSPEHSRPDIRVASQSTQLNWGFKLIGLKAL